MMESPVGHSQWWSMADWNLLTSFPLWASGCATLPPALACPGKALVKCLLLGCVVMVTTWDQARKKQAPTVSRMERER